ncbi:MAG: cyclophilin-like fold protein [Desulfobacterales bacterium]|nr:cyclophilin-like fold protein [Desulfobacterales bacterium]
MRKILISAGEITATAVLKENPTADAVWKALPLESRANTWGDEIYFGIPVEIKEADGASDVVNKGELAYWPPGKAFCIFFGRTPASRADEIRAASAVNVFGSVEGDATIFKKVPHDAMVKVSKAEG